MTAIQIADSFDSFAIDHTPDGWPAVQQKQLTEAAAELRRLEAQLQKETAARQAAQIEAEALKERLVRADAEKCAAVLAERIAPNAPVQEPEKLNPLTQLQVAYVMGLRDSNSALQAAPVQEPSAWLPMDTAPKDGTHVFLQVEFEDHAMEDGPTRQQTIGSNTSENDGGPDEWQFAGWDWVHDRYTQGVGTPVSWLPKTALLALVQQPAMQEPECYKWEEYCKWAKGWGWDTCESEYDPRLPEYAKYHEGTDFDGPNVRNFRALYTAPQAQQPAPPADVPMLTAGELNLARQWFGCIQDINGGWLDTEDFKLAIRLYEMCGMRVPDSVRQKAGLPLKMTPLETETVIALCDEIERLREVLQHMLSSDRISSGERGLINQVLNGAKQ